MDILSPIIIFASQTFILVFGVIIVILLIFFLAAKAQDKPEIEIELLHKKYKDWEQQIRSKTLTKSGLKKELKRLKKQAKEEPPSKKVYVIEYKDDVKASHLENLSTEINAIISTADNGDQVVVKVESPGGVVHGYGLAASQLLRFREKNIPLTVCVDKVAASGGYLMSVPAQKIVAAPFAIIGSIGVIAQVPNFNRLLKKYDVDYKEYTAGEFKRTISLLGEITPNGEKKFKEQLESTHVLFKDFVSRLRPQLDLHQVATGEYWYGEQALKLGLIDEIKTSDEYLMNLAQDHQIIKVKFSKKESLSEKISGIFGQALHDTVLRVVCYLENKFHL